jgi:cytochrome c oxidase subunit 4
VSRDAADFHPGPSYVSVFTGLVVLTVVEVAVVYMSLSQQVLAAMLLISALAKAALVALYFMHLRHEVKLIISTFVVPLLLGAMFLIALFPDIVLHASFSVGTGP